MLSVGLDLHKRYSQLEVVDDTGARRAAVGKLLVFLFAVGFAPPAWGGPNV